MSDEITLSNTKKERKQKREQRVPFKLVFPVPQNRRAIGFGFGAKTCVALRASRGVRPKASAASALAWDSAAFRGHRWLKMPWMVAKSISHHLRGFGGRIPL